MIILVLQATFGALARLPFFMGLFSCGRNRGHDRLRTAALIIVTSAAALPASAQLASRPATVVLVARLESLSVAQSSTLPAGRAAAKVSAVAGPVVSVTSSWALPANSTTMRVVAYTVDATPVLPLSAGSQVESSGTAEAVVFRWPLWNAAPSERLFTQAAATNAFTSRTDALPSASSLLPVQPTGALLIVAQAL